MRRLAHAWRSKKIGRYKIIRILGEGGMGIVYLAQASDGRQRYDCAVKFLLDAANPEMRERFKREAAAMLSLDAPGRCKAEDFGFHRKRPYIEMEYVEGESLKDLVDREGSQPVLGQHIRERIEILASVARSLHVAHQAGIVHRDIKPHNIIIRVSDGRPVIVDFGIARDLHRLGTTLTETWIPGTPAYKSPEQFQGDRGDQRSDIWSLGVTLYKVLSGRVPFDYCDLDRLRQAVLTEEPADICGVNGDVPEGIREVLRHALARLPGDRYQTTEEFAADLHRALAGSPIHGPRDPRVLADYRKYLRQHHRRPAPIFDFLADAVLEDICVVLDIERQQGSPTPARSVLTLRKLLELSIDPEGGATGRWLVLGPGGTGKSTACRLLCLTLGKEPGGPVPVLVSLSRCWDKTTRIDEDWNKNPFELAENDAGLPGLAAVLSRRAKATGGVWKSSSTALTKSRPAGSPTSGRASMLS